MEINTMKASLIHKENCRLCKYTRAHKSTCDSRGERIQKQNFGCAESMGWSSKICFVACH